MVAEEHIVKELKNYLDKTREKFLSHGGMHKAEYAGFTYAYLENLVLECSVNYDLIEAIVDTIRYWVNLPRTNEELNRRSYFIDEMFLDAIFGGGISVRDGIWPEDVEVARLRIDGLGYKYAIKLSRACRKNPEMERDIVEYTNFLRDLDDDVAKLFIDVCYDCINIHKSMRVLSSDQHSYICSQISNWMIEDIEEEYISHVIQFSSLSPEIGAKFAETAAEIATNEFLCRKYIDAVKFLIEKTKPPDAKDFHAEGLLARLLNPENVNEIVKSFRNPLFVEGYLYGDRLPAYSWSALSGKEMMKALTTGDYRAGYDAEKRLIGRAVRDIGERYG